MPNSFMNRNWELKYIKTIDCLDSISSNVRIAVVNNNIIRILPSLDEFYTEWITNKSRFISDSFNIQRLYYPKIKLNFKFIILSWKLILITFINLLIKKFNKFINVITGPFVNLELCLILKSFFLSISCNNINYFELTKILPDFRFNYLLNFSLNSVNKFASIFLIGTNPRIEAPLYNTYIRKSYLVNNNFKIFSLGLSWNYISYPIINLGNSLKNLVRILNGLNLVNKYFLFNNFYNLVVFNNFNKLSTQMLLGDSIVNRLDSKSINNILLFWLNQLNIKNNINFLQRNLGRINYLETYINNLNIIKKKRNNKNFFYLLGIDNFNLKKQNFNVFQGFFYISKLFNNINLIFPTSIYTEQITSYINLEGRFRYTNKVTNCFKFIFVDQDIVKTFSIILLKFFSYNFSKINNFYKIINFFKNIINYFKSYLLNFKNNLTLYEKDNFCRNYLFHIKLNFNANKIFNTIISRVIFNFYNSDIFSKKSKTMILASKKIININFL